MRKCVSQWGCSWCTSKDPDNPYSNKSHLGVKTQRCFCSKKPTHICWEVLFRAILPSYSTRSWLIGFVTTEWQDPFFLKKYNIIASFLSSLSSLQTLSHTSPYSLSNTNGHLFREGCLRVSVIKFLSQLWCYRKKSRLKKNMSTMIKKKELNCQSQIMRVEKD